MYTQTFLASLISILITSTVWGQNTIPCKKELSEKVGWIKFDPSKDDPNFLLCNKNLIQEYYQAESPPYKEGLKDIRNVLQPKFSSLEISSRYSGYVTLRFVVNCMGQTDRYRLYETDLSFKQVDTIIGLEKRFASIVKSMGNWNSSWINNTRYDMYAFITLRVESGQLTEIMP